MKIGELGFKIQRRIFHKLLLGKGLKWWQRFGINVTRNHYYSNIPDLNQLDESVFERISPMTGIELNVQSQLTLLSDFANRYRIEYDSWPEKQANYYEYYTNQTTFRSVDAQILHCMIRDLKPKRVIEVGSGFSTLITAKALITNTEEDNFNAEFVSIEPYPNDALKKGVPGLSKVIPKQVQEVDLSFFLTLSENDVLFLDSTHTVKIGGDVNYEVLELLPKLQKGVYVHIHDIFLPYEYPSPWIYSGERMWLEQYLVQAFLCNNRDFEIVWMSHYMHKNYPDKLKISMNFYEENVPYKGSLWLKKIS